MSTLNLSDRQIKIKGKPITISMACITRLGVFLLPQNGMPHPIHNFLIPPLPHPMPLCNSSSFPDILLVPIQIPW